MTKLENFERNRAKNEAHKRLIAELDYTGCTPCLTCSNCDYTAKEWIENGFKCPNCQAEYQ